MSKNIKGLEKLWGGVISADYKKCITHAIPHVITSADSLPRNISSVVHYCPWTSMSQTRVPNKLQSTARNPLEAPTRNKHVEISCIFIHLSTQQQTHPSAESSYAQIQSLSPPNADEDSNKQQGQEQGGL